MYIACAEPRFTGPKTQFLKGGLHETSKAAGAGKDRLHETEKPLCRPADGNEPGHLQRRGHRRDDRLLQAPRQRRLRECRDLKSPLSYTVSLATSTDSFSAMLSPQAGKNFVPYFSALKKALTGGFSQPSQQLSKQLSE